jgi:pimeloyl-ACP methyl ester carboxylesterase
MKPIRSSLAAVLTACAITACVNPLDDPPTAPQPRRLGSPGARSNEAALAAAPTIVSVDSVSGETGPGSFYTLYRPVPWPDRRLVVFAHGTRNPSLPVEPFITNDIANLRDALLALGYAFAWSTFSENGFAVKDGAQRTHQLSGLFTSAYGKPSHTYVTGRSLGGAIALMLAEEHPETYDGAMPQCGFVGGSHMEVDHIATGRILFDYFFPGFLERVGAGAGLFDAPPGLDYATVIGPQLRLELLAHPTQTAAMASVRQLDLVYVGAALANGKLNAEVVNEIVTLMGFTVSSGGSLLDRTHGHVFFDNAAVHYEFADGRDDSDLNAHVARFTDTPDARNYLDHYYEPTGRLRIPVLTLHGPDDPVVPFSHEAVYAARVQAAMGDTALLVRVKAPGPGHCTSVTTALQVANLAKLVAWAESGRTKD